MRLGRYWGGIGQELGRNWAGSENFSLCGGILFSEKALLLQQTLNASTMNIRLLLALLLLPAAALAQTAEADRDTLLTRLYERAANLMGEGQLEAAQQRFDSAFAVAGVEQSPVYPILLNEQATLYVYQGDERRGLEGKKSVLPHLHRTQNQETHVSVYNDLGILYRRAHEPDSALRYYNKALEAALHYGDESWLAHLNMNLAVFHYNLKHFAEAEQYIDRAWAHALKTDERLAAFNALQVGANIKLAAGHAEKAGQSIRQAWQMACEEDNAEWQLRCMSGFLACFGHAQQTDSLRKYINLGNRLLDEVPPGIIAARGYLQARAKAQMMLHRYAAALEDYRRLQQEDTGTDRHTLYADMALCYQALGDHDRAFACMDSARLWTDTLARRELTDEMARLNIKYRTKEQELQNARLNEQLLQKKATQLRILVAALCIVFLAVLGLLHLRQKQKAAERRLQHVQQEKEREAARRYTEGLEAECKHLAKELHDGIANELLALQMRIERAGNHPKDWKEISGIVNGLKQEIRAISHELMPPDFERIGLDEWLTRYASFLSASSGTDIAYSPGGHNDRLEKETAREVYRIIQETVSNSLTHGQASHIGITLETDETGHCTLTITDDGTPAVIPRRPEGIGLRTVDERAKSLQATLSRERTEEVNRFTLTFHKQTNA